MLPSAPSQLSRFGSVPHSPSASQKSPSSRYGKAQLVYDYEWDDGNEFAGTKYDDEPVAHIQSTAHPKEPKEPRTIGDPGAGGIFVIVLQSVVYLIGLVFCCGGLTYVVVQKNSGKSVWSAVPTLDPATLDPKSSVQMKKLAVTPDTTYSGSA